MSDNLNVTATFTAHDDASPIIRGLLANFRRLEGSAKRINTAFSTMAGAGVTSMSNFDRVTQAAAQSMGSFTTGNRTASRSVSEGWRRASDQRLRDAHAMYTSLERMEAGYQRQMQRRAGPGVRQPQGGGGRNHGGTYRLPAPSLRTVIIGGGIATAGVASAIKKRMEVDAAETRAAMFGDLSKADIGSLRGSFADRAGIKYGIGTGKVIDAATEGLKAGIAKQFAGEFADLALKAQTGLDVSSTDTAKLMGRLSTQMPWDKGRFGKILNAVAVANNETAADGSEIIEGMRRSLSALATTKMFPEQLAALNATGISLGIQPGKSGTFLSFLTSQIAGAGSAHGQNAKDLGSASGALGFGSRVSMGQAMRANPVATIEQMLDRLAKMPEALRVKVAKQIGGREWMDELLTLVLGRDKLHDVLKQIEAKPDFIDKAVLLKITSMRGRWSSISAAFGLVWEKAGAGLDAAFTQISTAIIDAADTFNFNTIRQHVEGLVDGLREGFGLKSWCDAIKALAASFSAGTIAKWREFATGFAEGVSSFANSLKIGFKSLAFIFGGDTGDAKGIGKLSAMVGGLAVSLAVLAPVISLFGALNGVLIALAMSPIGRLTMALGALALIIHRVLTYISDKIFSTFVSIIDAVQSLALGFVNKVRGWIGLSPLGGAGGSSSGRGATGSWSDAPPAGTSGAPGSWSPITGKAVKHFSSLGRPGSLAGGGTSGDLNSAAYRQMFAGTALARKDAQIIAAAKANDIDPALLAAVIAHETGKGRNTNGNNVAGLMNPDTGFRTKQGFTTIDDGISAAARVVAKNYKRADGDLGKMGSSYAPVGAANDLSGLNKNWPGAVSGFRNQLSDSSRSKITGGAGSGDALSIAERYKGLNEYRDTAKLAGFMGGRDPRGNAQAWCAAFVNSALKEAGGKGTGSAIANSFQKWGDAVAPEATKRGDVVIETGGKGAGQTGGHVGFATGKTRMGKDGLELEMYGGNQGDSAGYKWTKSNRNLMIRRGAASAVPPTANVPGANIQNVPPAGTSSGTVPGMQGASYGGSTIHINGSNHDPEALATLVQRRIDEQHNYRLNDVDSSMS